MAVLLPDAKKLAGRSRSPVKVSEQQWPSDAEPLVSFCCITYNHAPYIRECLDSFLAQETTFPVEIVVHDDASTDGTREILKEYEARHPGLFHNILQDSNQMSVGGDINTLLFTKARGHYIALCEGDDYWTLSGKIENQVGFMLENPDLAGCFHNSVYVSTEGQVIDSNYFSKEKTLFTQKDCIETLLSQYATSSLLFVRDAAKTMPPWFLRRPSDFFLDLLITGSGPLGFLSINASVYRKQQTGIWSRMDCVSQYIEQIRRFQVLLEEPDFSRSYADLLHARIEEYKKNLYSAQDHWKEVSELDERLNQLSRENAVLHAIAYPSGLSGLANYIFRLFPLLATGLKARLPENIRNRITGAFRRAKKHG